MGKHKTPRQAHTRLSEGEIFSNHPEGYEGVQHFLTITYIDSTVRRANRTRDIASGITPNESFERRIRTLSVILTRNEASAIEFIDLEHPNCKPEYIEKLKQWDGVTDLKYWCGMNDIPYWTFQKKTMKRQIISIVGDALMQKTYKSKKIRNFINYSGKLKKMPCLTETDNVKKWDKE